MVDTGPFTPSTSAFKSSRLILYIASACKGISGRDQASGAGEKSSVLVSPATLNTVKVTVFGYSLFDVNQVASAHDLISSFAVLLPLSASAATSSKAL